MAKKLNYRVRRENLYTPIIYILYRDFLYGNGTLGGTNGVSPKWLYKKDHVWPLYRPLQRLKLKKYKNPCFFKQNHTLGCNFLYTISTDWSKTTQNTGGVGGSGGVPKYLYKKDIFILSLTLTEPIFKKF